MRIVGPLEKAAVSGIAEAVAKLYEDILGGHRGPTLAITDPDRGLAPGVLRIDGGEAEGSVCESTHHFLGTPYR